MVATDSYRLAVREMTATAEGEAKALVPERALTEAGRAAAGEEKGEVELFLDAGSVAFRVGALTMTSRLIEGEFPPYRSLLPEDYESRLTVSRQQLQDAVRRVGLLARENSRSSLSSTPSVRPRRPPRRTWRRRRGRGGNEGAGPRGRNPGYLSDGGARDGRAFIVEVRDG